MNSEQLAISKEKNKTTEDTEFHRGEWEEKAIRDFALLVTKGTTPTSIGMDFSKTGITFVKIESIVNNKIEEKLCAYISENTNKALSRSILQENDILISIAGALGRCAIVKRNILPANTNQALALIRLDEKKVNIDYIYWYLQSDNVAKFISGISVQGAQANLSLENIKDLPIPLPPLPEQRRIAEVLSDTDELIATLEKLIAKKKAIKQGAMQELLTGKRRLPGFSGEWVERKLGDCLIVGHGQSQKNIENRNGKYPILATSGVIGWTNYFMYDKPSVLIGRKGTIDKPQYMETPFWTIDTLFYTIINQDNSAKYLYYLFCTIGWSKLNEASGVPSLSRRVIEDIDVFLPPTHSEQTAIANILSDMDAEIDALLAKLSKYKNIKYGMMNELLTGRIRLVQPAGNIFKFPEPEELMEHAKLEEEKVIIMTGIVNDFYHPAYPLGRKKVQKLYYMFQRHQHGNILGFKEKAAGPYDEGLRYFIEPLAESNGYIITEENEKGTIFFKGARIQEALDNIKERGIADSFNWLKDHFLKTSAEKLELLSTVDWALEKLKNKNIRISLTSVKKYIQESEEWKEKLNRELFSDKNIADAIKWSNELFGQENNT